MSDTRFNPGVPVKEPPLKPREGSEQVEENMNEQNKFGNEQKSEQHGPNQGQQGQQGQHGQQGQQWQPPKKDVQNKEQQEEHQKSGTR
jgi:hypothetical protein